MHCKTSREQETSVPPAAKIVTDGEAVNAEEERDDNWSPGQETMCINKVHDILKMFLL